MGNRCMVKGRRATARRRVQALLSFREVAGDWDIWWGVNLGTPDEALVAGRQPDVVDEIVQACGGQAS